MHLTPYIRQKHWLVLAVLALAIGLAINKWLQAVNDDNVDGEWKNKRIVLVDVPFEDNRRNKNTYNLAGCKHSLLKDSVLWFLKTDPTKLAQDHIGSGDLTVFAENDVPGSPPERFEVWNFRCTDAASEHLQSLGKSKLPDRAIIVKELGRFGGGDEIDPSTPGYGCFRLHGKLQYAFHTLYNMEKIGAQPRNIQEDCRPVESQQRLEIFKAQWKQTN